MIVVILILFLIFLLFAVVAAAVVFYAADIVFVGATAVTQCFQPKDIRIRKTEYSTPKTRFWKFEY